MAHKSRVRALDTRRAVGLVHAIMTWTAEQIREWFEARPRFEYEPGLFKGAPRGSSYIERVTRVVESMTPEELDRLYAEHTNV